MSMKTTFSYLLAKLLEVQFEVKVVFSGKQGETNTLKRGQGWASSLFLSH